MDYSGTNYSIKNLYHPYKSLKPGSLHKINPNHKFNYYLIHQKPIQNSIDSNQRSTSQEKTNISNISCSYGINQSLSQKNITSRGYSSLDNFPFITNQKPKPNKIIVHKMLNHTNRLEQTDSSIVLNNSNSYSFLNNKKSFEPFSKKLNLANQQKITSHSSQEDQTDGLIPNNKINKDILKCEFLLNFLKKSKSQRNKQNINIIRVTDDLQKKEKTDQYPTFAHPQTAKKKERKPSFDNKNNKKEHKVFFSRGSNKSNKAEIIKSKEKESKNSKSLNQKRLKSFSVQSVINSTSPSSNSINMRMRIKNKSRVLSPFSLERKQSDHKIIIFDETETKTKNKNFLVQLENVIKFNRINYINDKRNETKKNIISNIGNYIQVYQKRNSTYFDDLLISLVEKEINKFRDEIFFNAVKDDNIIFNQIYNNYFLIFSNTKCKLEPNLIDYLFLHYFTATGDDFGIYLENPDFNLFGDNGKINVKTKKTSKILIKEHNDHVEQNLYKKKKNFLFIQNKIFLDFLNQFSKDNLFSSNQSTIHNENTNKRIYSRKKTARAISSLDILKHKNFFIWRKNKMNLSLIDTKKHDFLYELPITNLVKNVGKGNFIKSRGRGKSQVDILNIFANSANIFEALVKLIKINELKLFIEVYNQRKNEIDINEQDPKNGNTLLIYSIIMNAFEISNYLLEKGADPNIENSHNNTALHYAFSYKNFKVADLLTKSGAKENIVNKLGLTPWECINHNCEDENEEE